MMRAILIMSVLVALLPSCYLTGKAIPCAGDVNCPTSQVCVQGLCEKPSSDPSSLRGEEPEGEPGSGGGPSARLTPAMTYDVSRGVVLLFGGYDTTGFQGDTWEWNGVSWAKAKERDPSGVLSPTPRDLTAMTYDVSLDVVVLFGGRDATGSRGDTWEWDGTSWEIASEGITSGANGPNPRDWHAMTYDASQEVSVLFGGVDANSNALGDTWEWDGASWIKKKEDTLGALSPTSRIGSAMVYDASRGVSVLFGGAAAEEYWDDTWEWDGANTTWTNVHWGLVNGNAPAPRYLHAMTYDAFRGVTVLFGGFVTTGAGTPSPTGDTWEWDGASWTKGAEEDASGVLAPIPRAGHGMAYDARRGVSVLFGGIDVGGAALGDTWEWDGASWTLVYTE